MQDESLFFSAGFLCLFFLESEFVAESTRSLFGVLALFQYMKLSFDYGISHQLETLEQAQ